MVGIRPVAIHVSRVDHSVPFKSRGCASTRSALRTWTRRTHAGQPPTSSCSFVRCLFSSSRSFSDSVGPSFRSLEIARTLLVFGGHAVLAHDLVQFGDFSGGGSSVWRRGFDLGRELAQQPLVFLGEVQPLSVRVSPRSASLSLSPDLFLVFLLSQSFAAHALLLLFRGRRRWCPSTFDAASWRSSTRSWHVPWPCFRPQARVCLPAFPSEARWTRSTSQTRAKCTRDGRGSDLIRSEAHHQQLHNEFHNGVGTEGESSFPLPGGWEGDVGFGNSLSLSFNFCLARSDCDVVGNRLAMCLLLQR
eukprot:scaffold47_cov334-Pavlova_lutheri.AAC.23